MPDARRPDDVSEPEEDIPYSAELYRKALHMIALVVPLFIALVGKRWALIVLLPASLLALTADVLRVRSAAFAGFIYRTFGFMMRSTERPPVGGPVNINGATWVLVSATLLTLAFPIRIAVPVFIMFMVSDAAAALIGRRFGRHRWGRSARTVEGSAAFLVTGTLIMALFPAIDFWIGATSVLCAAAAEALPRPFNDNLRVPFVAAGVVLLLEWLL